ncbi:glycoside hydrolase family 76 protein [Parapedobacter deserti]|uniref:Glycoside hydrolase family 76 protein n=2 Tax=Parapedobacter deserti TaxID=1912957 RepID=A0ABV7JKX3_9SPHI
MLILLLFFFTLATGACGSHGNPGDQTLPDNGANTTAPAELAERNLLRAMELADAAVAHYFTGEGMAMARFYNPYTDVRSNEKGSVWMYTAPIEAVNAILHALQAQKAQGHAELHDAHVERYRDLLARLYDNLAYYQGTFELTSFTQTREWTVYGVHRASSKGNANVAGIENVYDDQQWLVRELLHSYKLTGDMRYLQEAEYLTEYVLDGWDCTLDASGKVNGGIPWGPGYTTKHSCSNGPFISSLVWLHEHYTASDEEIQHRYIAPGGKRETTSMKKRDYYLRFAEAVYAWQKDHLLRQDGVYDDFMGGCGNCDIRYETVDGVRYRANTPLSDRVGPPYSYNTGSMLSGATDLYRATGNTAYLNDLKKFSDDSFRYFAKTSERVPGHFEYAVTGFNNWFNGVLMRAYIEAYPAYNQTAQYINTFQQNLDYGYANFLHNGILPHNLLEGWDDGNRNVEGMFAFTFAAEYALLSEYALGKE